MQEELKALARLLQQPAPRRKLPPIRRWSQVTTDANGLAAGATTQDPGLKLDIARDGYICAVGVAVFDPALNANETVNLYVDGELGVNMLVNDESPTNFKFIRMRNFAGSGTRLRRVLYKVKIADAVRMFFQNNRTAGAALQIKMDFGFCDTRDVEDIDDDNDDDNDE